MGKMRWQDPVNMVLGVWIAASPWVIGVAEDSSAMWNAVIVGGLILVLAAIDLDSPGDWEEWVTGALGVWFVLSPWILGFAASRAMMFNCLVSGVVVAALAASTLYERSGRRRRHVESH